MFEIIPSILEKDWQEIEKKIEAVLPFAHTIHIDVMDGKFSQDTTFMDSAPFKKYATKIQLEVHLMVDDPISYLQPWSDAGFIRFYAQIESLKEIEKQQEFVEKGQLLADIGFALDLNTSLSSVKVPFEDLDGLLLMAVKAGASGQKFQESIFVKIQDIMDKTFLPIEIDGGVNDLNIGQIKNTGITSCAVNSFIFNADPLQQFNKLKTVAG